jgi:quercetin dioxygenase-like cupin family protein
MMQSAGLAAFAGALVALILSFVIGSCYAPGLQILCSTSSAERPRTSTTIISSRALADVPGKRITTMLVDFPPGAYSPKHHHEASLYVHVLSGTIRSQLEGEPAGIFKTGEGFHEPYGAIHLFAENVSLTEPAQVLAVFVHDEGARLVVFHD